MPFRRSSACAQYHQQQPPQRACIQLKTLRPPNVSNYLNDTLYESSFVQIIIQLLDFCDNNFRVLHKMAISMQETFSVLQETLFTFPIFPVLWTAHCIVQCLNLRTTINGHHGSALDFARQSPLSCFILTIFYTFPGGIMGCVLSSEPPWAVLANTNQVVVMLISWYLVFYCPNDMFEKTFSAFLIRTPLCIMQDFQRLHLVINGVNKIHKLYPSALLYPVVFSTCSSSGFMFLKANLRFFTNKCSLEMISRT